MARRTSSAQLRRFGLLVDMGSVGLECANGNEQVPADFGIGQPEGHNSQRVELAVGQLATVAAEAGGLRVSASWAAHKLGLTYFLPLATWRTARISSTSAASLTR